MEVDEAKSPFEVAYIGVTYYFCSLECRDTFRRLAKVFSKDSLESMSPIRSMEPWEKRKGY